MTGFHRHRVALAGAAAFVFLPFHSYAEEPVETAIKEMVAAIDASPDWNANYRGLTYDPTTTTAVLSGLTITTLNDAVRFGFDTISVSGYVADPAGGFAAKNLTTVGGALDAGVFKMAISDAAFDDLVVPTFSTIAYDAVRPFTSMMRMYSQFTKAKIAHGRVGSIALTQLMGGVTSRVSYESFIIDNFAEGKIAAVKVGQLRMEAPSPEGLVTLTVGGAESTDIDLDAFGYVYDPERYVNGVGDMIWRTGLGHAAYHDVVMDVPGARVTLGEVSIDDFKLRQPTVNFGDFFDQVMSRPDMPQSEQDELARRHFPSLVQAFGFGRFSIGPLKVEAVGIDRLVMDEFYVADFSSDGLGEFAIEGVEAAVQGQGAVKIGRFAFGDIVFPSMDVLLAAMAADDRDEQVDPKPLIPHLGFIELGEVEVTAPEVPEMKLGNFRIDLGDYIGPVPTSAAIEMSGLEAPAHAITDPDARKMFDRLGYDRVVADYGLKLKWSPADESLSLYDAYIGLEQMGRMSWSLVLGGLPRTAIENPELLEAFIPGLSLIKGQFSFKDESIVGKSLDILAEQMKAPPEKFRQQFADAMPFLLSMSALNDPTLMAIVKQSGLLAKLTPVVKTFVGTPGSTITISLNPPSPVALPAIDEASEKAPDTLPALLGLDITGEAGTLTPPEENPGKSGSSDTEEMRPTIDPAN